MRLLLQFNNRVALSSCNRPLLASAVDQGKDFDQIFLEFNRQLGFEAQAILRALLADRDNGVKS